MEISDQAAFERSLKIDEQLKKDEKALASQIKLLLLGAADTGKSTFVKQMKIIYGTGYSIQERKNSINDIYDNILGSAKKLIKAMEVLKIEFSDATNLENAKSLEKISSFEGDRVSDEVWNSINNIWKDPNVQVCFKRRNEFQISDSAGYFFNKLDKIRDENYIPDESDILRIRQPTCGVHESFFKVGQYDFRLIDVGGQRSERRKWIHCFEGVTAVVFLAALSEYNQNLVESENENRLSESVELYKTILSYQWFQKSSIILFLNKKDLFADKIEKHNLVDYFKDYTGPQKNVDAAKDFIAEMFYTVNKSLKKLAFTHFTVATDTENMKFVSLAVKDTILRSNMKNVHIE